MTRRFTFAAALLGVLLTGAGCSDRGAPVIPEMDEPFYVQGVQLNKQTRHGEALTSFLKVIDRRGERGAPESHLEVGVIYLNHTKDPVRAYYHFKRYLELQPNSKEAPRVRGMVEASLREITKHFPGRPPDDRSLRLADAEEVAKLRRENDELRAELQTLRGISASARGGRMVSLGDDVRERAPTLDGAIIPAPVAPRTNAASLPTAKMRPTAANPPPKAGRMHTVRQSEGLFAIARKYDPQNTSRKMREIIDANRDVLPNGVNTPLRPGMTLRIP